MIIRPMSAADLEPVRLLASAIPEAPVWKLPVYQGFLEFQTGPLRRIFVAEVSGELAGFVAGRISLDVCELESIAVALSRRRSGVGSGLLATLTAWAGASHASKVQLEVRSTNRSAIILYERVGFSPDGLRRGYYRHPEDDALLMSLALPAPSVP